MSLREESTKLFWLDMEMTGLDVDKEVPIEVAVLVTDWTFTPLAQYHTVIHQEPKHLEAMDDWNKKHHGDSGLTALVPGGKNMALVDQELAAMIQLHFGSERAILAGNSINQDRLFIRKYLPLTEKALHYRMLDVTSWKVVFNGVFQKKFKKAQGHRALDDILESIAEFKYYLSFVKVDKAQT